jgi:hypothetical protein
MSNLRVGLAMIGLVLTGSCAMGQPKELAPIRTADFERRVGFRVNGQPFFPILLYDVPTDDASLRQFHDFGFNVLLCDAKTSSTLPAKGFYGAVHQVANPNDLSGLFLAVGFDSPALNFKTDMLKRLAETDAKTRAGAPGRPLMNAIGYWEDEPAGVFAGKLPSKEKYEDLIGAIDVSGLYLYPVPYQPVASVGEATARARAASKGEKPLLPIVQLFAWKADDRYPTPVELRCMTFLALVEGGHGIGYYSYSSVTGRPKMTIAEVQPELWKSVKSLNRELAAVGPRMIAGAESRALALDKGDSGVKLRVIQDDRGVLAVLVNPTEKRHEATIRVSGADAVRPLLRADEQPLEVRDGVARITLEPFAVEVLRSNPR